MASDERRFRPAWRSMWYLWPLVILVLPFFVMLYRRFSLLLVVRDDEVSFEEGFFSKKTTEVQLRDIKTIEVEQSFFQRLLGIGRIRLATSGTEGWEITIDGLSDPSAIRELVQRLRGDGL